jgi:hypothetical protein
MTIHSLTTFAQDKPNLYLSANAKNKDWRMTEILVAITESIIQGDEILTISSKNIKDVIDYSEQMDIVQIKKIDPSKYFNFIEVRDRNSSVSRNYVQEIIGKRKSTDIQECKIVSTFGFTQPAKKLAAHEKIDLRLFELDISPLNQYWFKTDTTSLHLRQLRLDRCFLHVKVNDKNNEYKILFSEQPEVQEKVLVFFNENNSPSFAIPIVDIFHREISKWPEAENKLFSQVPLDGQYHQINSPVELINIPPRIYVNIGEGDFNYVPVHGIKFNISSKINVYASKLSARYNYIDPISEKLIAQCIIFDFNVEQKKYYQVFVRGNFDDNSVKFGSVFFE